MTKKYDVEFKKQLVPICREQVTHNSKKSMILPNLKCYNKVVTGVANKI